MKSTLSQRHPKSIFGKYLLGRLDDLRSRIFGTSFVKFLASLLLLGFSNILKWVKMPIFNGFLHQKGHLEFSGAFFLAEIFEKVSFDPYNFRIARLSARKSEQMKNF